MKRAIGMIVILSALLIMAGCGGTTEKSRISETVEAEETSVLAESDDSEPEVVANKEKKPEAEAIITKQESDVWEEIFDDMHATTESMIGISEIPAYAGNAYAVINGNIPYFTDDEMSATSYEYYSELDSLGRCGVCVASIGQDIMPTEDRGEIGSVKPTGWQTVKYPGIVDGNYLYNRCHLIGFQLAGENANINNLITGTRYMNMEGMLPFENMVVDFVKETGYHVMYRVTPIFDGNNLVASGVLMEAKSVEDSGNGILFNVFCYNVQPRIAIDYATGNSEEDRSIAVEETSILGQLQEEAPVVTPESQSPVDVISTSGAYAVNSNNGKIHITGACPATRNGSNAMKTPVYFDTYEKAEAYSVQIAPSQDERQCGNCW